MNVALEVRRKAEALGAVGRRWLEELPATIAGLEREWDVTIGPVLPGGTEAYVAAAGERAVLKIALPNDERSHEIETLCHARGRGYVRLLRHDEPRRAMLLDRLGPRLAELGLPVAGELEIICATLREAWTVPPMPDLPTGAEKAGRLADFIATTWHELDRPCPEPVIERALAFADERGGAFDPATAVLVHGDAQSHNTLRAADGSFKLIDPDGLLAEPACDLAVPMREYSRELLAAPDTVEAARAHCGRLSHLTSVDAHAIWQWGFVERVSTGLLALRIGWPEAGAPMLAVAAAIA